MENFRQFSTVPLDEMIGEDDEETREFLALHTEAKKYIEKFSWCKKVKNSYFGLGVADIVGVFLFEIEPLREPVDSLLWVIVGDLPPAYLVLDDSRNPVEALASYIFEMRKWVNAVRKGESVEKLIPVNVKESRDLADMLDSRLDFLEHEVLEN